jgi:hypothetical protein
MKPLTPLTPEFTWAGFAWPRYVADMACGLDALRRKRDLRQHCGGYFHAPRPEKAGTGRGFYLGPQGRHGDGQPFRRWEWADEVSGVRIGHTGWFCDQHQDSKIRGIVVSLPHGRFLAGWSMGENMASSVDGTVYNNAQDAAYAADSMAESAAEQEREYQERQEEEQEEEGAEA